MVDEHDLKQLVESPTRRQGNAHNIIGSGIEVVPGISDHDMVLFLLKHVVRGGT